MCGYVLRRPERRPAPREPLIRERAFEREVAHEEHRVIAGMRAEPLRVPLAYLGLGLLFAPILTFTPLLRFMGWFLASLVHETGHCFFAWMAGSWSFPAISLAGHAMASHGPQSIALCFVIWFGIGALAWHMRHRRAWLIGLGALTLLYPLFAFTGLKEAVFLVGGHVGELAFAGIFFWRAIVGGFTESKAERALYALLAFFLVGQNLWLSGGLMWSAEVQEWYARSGSFGLTNDYIRLARDVLRTELSTVAGAMFVATLTVLPLSWFAARKLSA